MNNLLELKLRYNREGFPPKAIFTNLRKASSVSTEKVDQTILNLKEILHYYENVPHVMEGFLLDVHYNDIIPKSKRISELLKPEKKRIDDIIVGARFSDSAEEKPNHIITYYVDRETVSHTIEKLSVIRNILSEELGGLATVENFNEPGCKLAYDKYSLSKNVIRHTITDCSVIKSIKVPNITSKETKETVLITFFKTEQTLAGLLSRLEISPLQYKYSQYGDDTISVPWDLYLMIQEKVPYMISMVSSDLSKITLDSYGNDFSNDFPSIPSPSSEPTIGVIDSLFDESVYFSEWVENHDELENYELSDHHVPDRTHGTEVSSLIVDGPALNPWLDDKCGRFRVRHFGVCETTISVPRLMYKIRRIVLQNPDIHVWNLSLGTNDEVSQNFISYDASVLDELQASQNIIFVIAGTNDIRQDREGYLRIGSPADSLNSVVVNSVRHDGTPASYTRKGNVLSFFNKPDVSYFGGDYLETERLFVCAPYGITTDYGTSLAAPWISRKMCYLIDVLGFPKEVAKALLIDSAAGWDYKIKTYLSKDLLGYGIVPVKISDVVNSENNEIRFLLYGAAQSYKTSNYAIPIPKDSNDKYPYIARATLCYFPKCSRAQGVDYTLRELSLKFGRVKEDGTIKDINDNIQDDNKHFPDERQARDEFRKWENTKFISKKLRKNRPLASYKDRLWGFSLESKERLTVSTKEPLNFGVVITLREIEGLNRIQDFITACTIRGWIVNEINVEDRINLYQSNQADISFDE